MTREEAKKELSKLIFELGFEDDVDERVCALNMAIQALSQVSEIEENIIKYMKKYPNHVGNMDFWEGFYACRNVVLQLDDEEYSPKEQEPCTDAVSREEVKKIVDFYTEQYDGIFHVNESIDKLPSVTQKSGHWIWCVGSHKCSNCEEYTCFSHKELLKYCPNCGAKMESEDKTDAT